MLGRRAVGLDLRGRHVTDDAGVTYRFGKLLLATGGAPRTIADASERVIYYRTVDDYRRLREATRRTARVVVIGGGFIGTELAAALQWSGNDVVMLVPEQGLGARQFPPDLSAFLVEYYRAKGVDVRLGERVVSVDDHDTGVVVRTHNDNLVADVAVAGIGIIPEVALAEGAGLAVANGIVVDELLRTGDPDVFAAGDVAAFPSQALTRRVRVEHEDNARTMGRWVGRNLAGEEAPYRHLPFFYSDLYDLGYEAVGEVDSSYEVVADWREPFREGVLYYVSGGRVRGVLLWNVWGQVDAARDLIADPGPLHADALRGRIEGTS